MGDVNSIQIRKGETVDMEIRIGSIVLKGRLKLQREFPGLASIIGFWDLSGRPVGNWTVETSEQDRSDIA